MGLIERDQHVVFPQHKSTPVLLWVQGRPRPRFVVGGIEASVGLRAKESDPFREVDGAVPRHDVRHHGPLVVFLCAYVVRYLERPLWVTTNWVNLVMVSRGFDLDPFSLVVEAHTEREADNGHRSGGAPPPTRP